MNTYILKDGRTLTIREARTGDAQLFIDYLKKVGSESDFLTFNGDEIRVTANYEESFIRANINTYNCLLIMAEVDGKVVGNLHFGGGVRLRTRHAGEFGITVIKEYWGLGIGSYLMENMIEWAKESEIRKINLKVRSDNKRAIELYKKFGFAEEGLLTREFYMNGVFYDILAMGLKID